MVTIDHPHWVSYEYFVKNGLYLRWNPIWMNLADYNGKDWYDIEDMFMEWLTENTTSRFSFRNWQCVNFENRRDAMMFKLAFC